MHVERAAHGPFRGRAAEFRVGSLGLLRIETDATTVLRTGRQVSTFDPELLQLALVRRGRCVIEQRDRTASLAAGDMTLYDTSAAFRIRSAEPYEMLVYAMPRGLLGAHMPRLRTRVAVRVPAHADVGGLAGRYLSELADVLERGGADAGDVDLADGVLALVRAVYTLQSHAGPSGARPAPQARLAAMKVYIEDHLSDPGLGPSAVARAHHVSPRRVHQLFADQGESVSGWIRARRLDRSRRELQDPALMHEAVSAIALRWGFTNHASFSRMYRATYGMSPSQARAAVPFADCTADDSSG